MTIEDAKFVKQYFEDIYDGGEVSGKLVTKIIELADEYIAANEKKPRTRNMSGVVQCDAETGKKIAEFTTIKEALAAIGKEKGSGISDAVNGRTSTHKAYGFKWYHKDEFEAGV